jgi:hypothetical protein
MVATSLLGRDELITIYRERIQAPSRKRLLPMREAQVLIAGFVDLLRISSAISSLKALARDEIKLLEEGLSMSKIQSEYLPVYRDAVQEALLQQSLSMPEGVTLHPVIGIFLEYENLSSTTATFSIPTIPPPTIPTPVSLPAELPIVPITPTNVKVEGSKGRRLAIERIAVLQAELSELFDLSCIYVGLKPNDGFSFTPVENGRLELVHLNERRIVVCIGAIMHWNNTLCNKKVFISRSLVQRICGQSAHMKRVLDGYSDSIRLHNERNSFTYNERESTDDQSEIIDFCLVQITQIVG